MDIQTLAQQMASFLMPLLPCLLKIGDKAAEEVGKKIGGEGWERAKALWERLRRKKSMEQVAQTAAALPDNQALRDALREEIARALQEDGALRREIVHLWGEAIGVGEGNAIVGEGIAIVGEGNVIVGEGNAIVGEGNAIVGEGNAFAYPLASGDRSVAIGGDVSGSTIITGDHNKI